MRSQPQPQAFCTAALLRPETCLAASLDSPRRHAPLPALCQSIANLCCLRCHPPPHPRRLLMWALASPASSPALWTASARPPSAPAPWACTRASACPCRCACGRWLAFATLEQRWFAQIVPKLVEAAGLSRLLSHTAAAARRRCRRRWLSRRLLASCVLTLSYVAVVHCRASLCTAAPTSACTTPPRACCSGWVALSTSPRATQASLHWPRGVLAAPRRVPPAASDRGSCFTPAL